MKRQLALFVTVLVISFMSPAAIAQVTTAGTASTPSAKPVKKGKAAGGGAAHKADAELADLTKSLNLTEDQQAKIKSILVDESAKIRAERKGPSITADEAKAKHKEIREEANKQIRALLNPDQQKLFDASKMAHGDNSGDNRPATEPSA